MNYLIDSHTSYFAEGGLLGKLAEGINWLFVDLPFFILRMVASSMLMMQQLLDQSDLVISKQQNAYDLSMTILKNFGGKEIQRGSLIALLLVLSAYYLVYSFFISKKNFSKILLHYLAVFLLFVFWFGSISTPSGTKSGGLFLVESVSNIADGVKNSFTSGSSDFSKIDSEQALDDTPLFNATIKQTFYYVNSGSLDGEMENGKKIDEKKLLMPNNLSKEKRKKFEQERKDYLNSIKDENPYVQVSLDKTMEKTMAIITGGINTMVTSYPAMYVSAMLTVIQLLITLLIIVAPVFFLLSFIPACQSMLFKFFKLMIGLLFFPIILGVFLAVFFWANKVIDSIFLGIMKSVATPILTLMSGGIFVLVANIILIIVKFFLYKSIWKNKYRLLSFFTDDKVGQPEILEKAQEKADEVKERTKEITYGGAEMALGAYTGNQMLLMDGANRLMPNDKAMNLSRYNFRDSNMDEPEGSQGLNDWVDNQEEPPETTPKDESVEFVEVDESMDEGEPELGLEEVDHSLTDDKMTELFEEVSDEGLEDGSTVSVDNLDEINLATDGEVDELRELEQIEKETMIEKGESEFDREFPDDRFFGDTLEKEVNEFTPEPFIENELEERNG